MLLAVRAAIIPPVLRFITPSQEPNVVSPNSPYVESTAAWAAGGLAAIVLLCAVLAGRRPLLMTMLALFAFTAVSVPFVLANPNLITGGHLTRAVVGLLLLRAAFYGFAHRMR